MKRKAYIMLLIAAIILSGIHTAPAAMAAKKPALNKKSAKLTVGDKLKLKVKNNKKKVKWSSSKKKVATVSKKGQVTAKSAGKAKITAAIGKKKLVCKVTVKAKESGNQNQPDTKSTGNKIDSVSVIGKTQVKVVLSSPQALTKNDFIIKVKAEAYGTYNRKLIIRSITTTDNKTYIIDLEEDSRVWSNDHVSVTVNNLQGTGTATVETVVNYRTAGTLDVTSIMSFVKGEYANDYTYLPEAAGYNEIGEVKGMPPGMSYKLDAYGFDFIIYGTPEKEGIYNVTFTVKDEAGNVYNYTIVCIVGTEDALYGACETAYVLADGTPQLGSYENITGMFVDAVGGSGEYIYSFDGNSYGMNIDTDGKIHGYIQYPGVYNIKVNVVDKNIPTRTTSVNCTIVADQGRIISGTVKDMTGNPMLFADTLDIYVTPKKSNDRYIRETKRIHVMSDGKYSFYLPDGEYEIYAICGVVRSDIKNIKVNADTINLDFTVPVYKIDLEPDDNSVASLIWSMWDDVYNGDTYYISGDLQPYIFLAPGTYSLLLRRSNGVNSYKMETGKFTVDATTKKVAIHVTKKSVFDGARLSGVGATPVTLSDQKHVYLKFVPQSTGKYEFYSTADSGDQRAALLDPDGNIIEEDDDSGSGNNFRIEADLTEGKAYYLEIWDYNPDEKEVIIQIAKM